MSNRQKNKHTPFLIVLSSPSGAGKTTICHEVAQKDRNIGYSISATTRPKRPDEINGRDYFFFNRKEFERKRNQGEFVETAKVYGYYYGTPVKEIKRILGKGKDVIMDLDTHGMKSIKRLFPNSVAIFITTSNLTELQNRLSRRAEEKTEISRRANYLKAELAAMPKFDYLVRNDDIKVAVDNVLAIIQAERLNTKRLTKFSLKFKSRRN
ncbi:MAG: guanylate kinase [candidate division WOR-3 bacterium]|nr:guanylate kinase [candidate division WOR-3 bacterium]